MAARTAGYPQPMPRVRTCLVVVVLALGLLPGAAAAQAPPPPPLDRIAPGVKVAGVDVSNLTLPEAAARVDQAFSAAFAPKVSVAVAGRRFKLSNKTLGFKFDPAKTARRAYNAGRKAQPVPDGAGGWAWPADVAPWVRFRTKAVERFVGHVASSVYIAPRNADVRLSLRSVRRTRSREGRRLDSKQLREAISANLPNPAAPRQFRATRTVTKPTVTADELPARYPTILTIDRGGFKLRLFKGLKLAKTYSIAVGAAGYDTPGGRYSISNKAVNPAWSAPNSPWAGLYAGRTVPGGAPDNPLKARWLGIINGVGIHGTGDPGSIGTRASHGCIRMTVPDVIDLYPRVPVGTPVLIG
jgi:lipoprotein-anchoring transpeptidase ErfK/SrfK